MRRVFVLSLGVLGVCLSTDLVACVGDDPGPPTSAPDAAPIEAAPPNDAPACAVACNGVCVDTQTDAKNCGGCGKTCVGKGGESFSCVGGHCGNEVAKVAGGNLNACVLLREGTVYCWGRQNGVTGPPSSESTAVPMKIAGIENAVDIALGAGYGVARRIDGSVVGWDADGVAPVAFAAKVVQLAGSFVTACGTMENGAVACSGFGLTGVLGVLPADGGAPTSKTPLPINGVQADVIEVSVSNGGVSGDVATACAVKKDGTVWCWGGNAFGQLGHAKNSDGDVPCEKGHVCNTTARPVRGSDNNPMTGFVEVDVGDEAACARRQDGSVWCWGARKNGNGGFGNPLDTAEYPVPAQVPNLNTTSRLAFGWNAAFAIDTMGGVRSWGANGWGTLALGNFDGIQGTATSRARAAATSAPLLQGVAQISVTTQSAIALRADGKVVTWGSNSHAQLGHARNTNEDGPCPDDGSQPCNATPREINGLP